MSILDLPAVNGTLNGLSAIFLTAGYVFIRRKNITAHRNCMIAAFVTSVLFLACYLTYHFYLGFVLHRGPTVFKKSTMVSSHLPDDSHHSHHAGRGDRTDGVHDAQPRGQTAV